MARHQRRRRATRQTLPSLLTQRQVSTPCDATSALILLQIKPCHTVALNIKGELHGEASRWRYLIVAYDLHPKWPEVRAFITVTSRAVSAFSRNCSRDGVYRQKASPTIASSSCRARLKSSSNRSSSNTPELCSTIRRRTEPSNALTAF